MDEYVLSFWFRIKNYELFYFITSLNFEIGFLNSLKIFSPKKERGSIDPFNSGHTPRL